MTMNRLKIDAQRNIKGVLFDFDGTLTYPGALDFDSIRREMGCPENRPILEYIEAQDPSRRSLLLKILESKEEKAAEGSVPNRGAEKCLTTLKEKSTLIGILTRNTLESVRLAMESFSSITIEDFRAIITRENSLPKPHPDGVYKAAVQMGISTSELMMVGDFRFDVIAGKAAGAFSVLLTNNGGSVMTRDDPEPDYIVDNLSMILTLL